MKPLCYLDREASLKSFLEFEEKYGANLYSQKELKFWWKNSYCALIKGVNTHRDKVPMGQLGFFVWPHHVELVFITVQPAFQRQGVASALVDRLELEVRSNPAIKTLVTVAGEDNLPAHLFLKANGFKVSKILPTEPAQYMFWRPLRRESYVPTIGVAEYGPGFSPSITR